MGLYNSVKDLAIENTQVYLKKLEGEDEVSSTSM